MALTGILGVLLLHAAVRDTVVRDTVVREVEFDARLPPELTGEVKDDADGSALMEALDWVRMHPYDLNTVTLPELLSIPCVTLSGARAVLAYRAGGGTFRSPAEVLTMDGGGAALYEALAPYVRAGAGASGRRVHPSVSVRFRVNGRSDPDPLAPGPAPGVLSRIVVETGRAFETGALFAKGAGERLEDAFVSGYARVQGLGCVTDVLAGDYEIQSAEGLVFWRGPTAVRGIWKLRAGGGCAIEPHRSPGENRFLRGLAVTASSGERWRGSIFVSDRSFGAAVDSTGDVTGFFQGAYVTQSSLGKKDALRERLAGVRAEFHERGIFSGGCTFYRSFLDRSFHPADRMRFSGDRAGAIGADVSVAAGIAAFSGEYAVAGGGAHGLSCSLALSPGEDQMWIIRCRDYQPRFDNPHASGEGDGSGTRNERGVTTALRIVPSPECTLEVYADAYEHPWPDAGTSVPRKGIELSVMGEGSISRRGRFSVRLSRKVSTVTGEGIDAWGRDVVVRGTKDEDRLTVELSARPGRILTFSALLGFAGVSETGADYLRGFLVGADVSLAPFGGVRIDGRWTAFHTDGYGASVYAFESSLPGLVSVPPLYGDGLRWYVRLLVNPADWAEIALRCSGTVKERSATTGAPVTEIPPSSPSQIGLQLDIRVP